ncbi:g-protein alpha subunit [Ancylostoma ceylanicum]|uniref:G-protein alpha subunit n=1 Tax=Ancylostoma ceylanicum TaxID=53326 RepID=A0A0D6M6Q2_9BILA|nr:g-protein alpha subunit [Ancylostoma ceylanicum]
MGSASGGLRSAKTTPEEKLKAVKSKQIDKSIENERNKAESHFKILLLGGSECGKTTIFKQMRVLHLNGFSREDALAFKPSIHYNIMSSLTQLLTACASFKIFHENSVQEAVDQFTEYVEKIKNVEDGVLTPAIGRSIEKIWHSSDCSLLRMIDVGGQRSERRKWIHCFDNVDMVLFVVSVSDFDTIDPEDPTQNRLLQNYFLFKTIAQSELFRHSSIVLFLNKYDIFKEKLQSSTIRQCDDSLLDATHFIQTQFRNCIHERHRYFSYITVATDTENIQLVFDSATAHIINENLKSTGLRD